MKALRASAFGGPEVVRLEDVPRPEPKAGEALVRVRAAAVNPVDWLIRGGFLPHLKIAPPYTIGCEMAGVMENACGRFHAGDEVYGYLSLLRNGADAEYAMALETELAAKPAGLSFAEAASYPVAALTAWQALFDTAHLQAGQTILIHGAAGSVGAAAVQLAKWKGARVIGTASGANLPYLAQIGVDVPVDYKTEKFEDKAHQVDVVLNTVSGETLERSFAVLRKGGVLVSVSGVPSPEKAAEFGVTALMMGVMPNGARLEEVSRLIETHVLHSRIDRVFPIEQGVEALAVSEKGQARGKLVLEC